MSGDDQGLRGDAGSSGDAGLDGNAGLDQAVWVIGLAHGSRHPAVPGSIAGVMEAVHQLSGGTVPTAAAYLDLTDPDLTTVARDLIARGARRAVVVPLLFTQAFHATVDVPEAVRAAADASGLELQVAPVLGTGADVQAVVHASIAAAGITDTAPILLFSVGSSDEAANDAVAALARRIGVDRGTPAAAAFGTRPPRTAAVLPELGPDAAIVPLFVSPGLLLDPLIAESADQGRTMAPPLEDLVAPLVLARLTSVVSAPTV